jgi:hypothetical protein
MYTGPNVTNDNLVFGYDTGYGVANTAVSIRFYKGKPATNLASGLIKVFGSWNNLVGTTEYYTRNGSQGVRLVVTSGGGVHWHSSNQINNVSSSTQYTVSATVKWNGVTPHPNLFYIRQYNSSGNQVTENGYFSTSYMIDLGDGWYRAYRTFTTTSTTDFVKLQGYQYAAGADIYYQDEQFELGALTPYTGDGATRSNTTSLIDLKRNIDMNVSNVSFDSTGQPVFDGTDDHIALGASSQFNIERNVTIESVVKKDSSGWNGIFGRSDGGSFIHYQLYNGTVNLYFYGPALACVTGNVITSTSKYYHIVATFDGSSAKIYVDGSNTTTTTTSSTANVSAADNVSVGKVYSSDRHFDGEIPVLKVYNRTLTSNEILQNYNAYKNRFNYSS